MKEFFETRVLGWVFGASATMTAADMVALGTGFLGLIGALFMAVSGWYSFRVKRREFLNLQSSISDLQSEARSDD